MAGQGTQGLGNQVTTWVGGGWGCHGPISADDGEPGWEATW